MLRSLGGGGSAGSASASEALEALQKQKCRQDEMLDELFHSTRSLNIKAQKIHEEISGQDGCVDDEVGTVMHGAC